MSWNQITIDVPDGLTDAIIGELSDDGVAGVWESSALESGLTRLVFYFSIRSSLEKIHGHIGALFSRASLPKPVIMQTVVEDSDWTGEWKKSYRSFPVGDDFFIIPSWEHSDCPSDRLAIRIDPGQAFGTGTHETTQLTIEALESWVEPRHKVLDVGTGSGILAIASRLLGAKEVFACDIDVVAAEVARRNIERNAEANVWTFCGSLDAVKSDSIGLLTANLTADLIMSLFQEFDRVLKHSGIGIFAGILQDQREDVMDVIARFRFTVHEEHTRGEWLALVAEKV